MRYCDLKCEVRGYIKAFVYAAVAGVVLEAPIVFIT